MITDVNINFQNNTLHISSDRYVAYVMRYNDGLPDHLEMCRNQFENIVSVKIDNQDTFNCISEPSTHAINISPIDGEYIGKDIPLDMMLPWADLENQLLYLYITTETNKYYFNCKTLYYPYRVWHKVEPYNDGSNVGYIISRDEESTGDFFSWIRVADQYNYTYEYKPTRFADFRPITQGNIEYKMPYFDESTQQVEEIKQYYGDTIVSLPGSPIPIRNFNPGFSSGLDFLDIPDARITPFKYDSQDQRVGFFKEVTTTVYKYVFFNKTALNRYLWNNVKHLLKRDCCGHLETINEDYLLMKDGFYNSIANNSYKEANEFWKLMHNQKNVIMSNCGCGK